MYRQTPLAGIAYGLTAYVIWGFFPLYFRQLGAISPLDILCHRTTWAFAFVALLLTLPATAALADEALPTLPAARWTDSAAPSFADANTKAPPRVLELAPLVQALCAVDATDTAAVQRAAAAFHRAMADALVAGVLHARDHWRGPGPAPHRVALSGGCFFNRLLRERVQHGLHAAGLVTALPTHRGCGDAGLALGQAWVAWQHCAHSPNQELLSCV